MSVVNSACMHGCMSVCLSLSISLPLSTSIILLQYKHCMRLFSAPEGLPAPYKSVINQTTVRISWGAPSKPNGDITGYYLYVNDRQIDTGQTTPGSYLLTNLQPYTIYKIQVCDLYAAALTYCKTTQNTSTAQHSTAQMNKSNKEQTMKHNTSKQGPVLSSYSVAHLSITQHNKI